MNNRDNNHNQSPENYGEDAENLHQVSIRFLLKKIREVSRDLVKKEIALAKAELKADIKSEAKMVGGLIVSAVAGLITITLLLVTVIFALALVLPGWLAALIVSAAALVFAIAAFLYGWGKRVKRPMVRTKEVFRADASLSKGFSHGH